MSLLNATSRLLDPSDTFNLDTNAPVYREQLRIVASQIEAASTAPLPVQSTAALAKVFATLDKFLLEVEIIESTLASFRSTRMAVDEQQARSGGASSFYIGSPRSRPSDAREDEEEVQRDDSGQPVSLAVAPGTIQDKR